MIDLQLQRMKSTQGNRGSSQGGDSPQVSPSRKAEKQVYEGDSPNSADPNQPTTGDDTEHPASKEEKKEDSDDETFYDAFEDQADILMLDKNLPPPEQPVRRRVASFTDLNNIEEMSEEEEQEDVPQPREKQRAIKNIRRRQLQFNAGAGQAHFDI